MPVQTAPRPLPRQAEAPRGVDFDVAGLVDAMHRRDAARWSDFFAVDAEWLSYRHSTPAQDPQLRSGNIAIHAFVASVCANNAHVHVEDLVVGDDSLWFRRMVRLTDGRMLIEHVHVRHAGGLITREIDVESWDYP